MPNLSNKCVAKVIFACTADLSELYTCSYFTPHEADPTLCVNLLLDGNLNFCTQEPAKRDAISNKWRADLKKVLTIIRR